MEVEDDNIVIDVKGVFYLDLPLPYKINEEKGKAKFDVNAKKTVMVRATRGSGGGLVEARKVIPTLTLTLPVQPSEENIKL